LVGRRLEPALRDRTDHLPSIHQATLHACGIGLGLLVGRIGEAYGNRILQITGSAMALAGIAILIGYL